MRRSHLFLAVPTIAALALSACGSSTPTATPVPPTATTAPAATATPNAPATLTTTVNASLNNTRIVTDANGKTLYTNDRDTAEVSACTGACLTTWPALMAPAGILVAVSDITVKLDVFTRPEGKQVTLNGKPLYYFVRDTAAGAASGSGLAGVWWTVKGDGSKVSISLQPTPTAAAGATGAPTTAGAVRASPIAGFQLQSFSIPVGTKVTWTNNDPTEHTVTSTGNFDGVLNKGDSYSFTFTKAGAFKYICTFHPSMEGTVTVL